MKLPRPGFFCKDRSSRIFAHRPLLCSVLKSRKSCNRVVDVIENSFSFSFSFSHWNCRRIEAATAMAKAGFFGLWYGMTLLSLFVADCQARLLAADVFDSAALDPKINPVTDAAVAVVTERENSAVKNGATAAVTERERSCDEKKNNGNSGMVTLKLKHGRQKVAELTMQVMPKGMVTPSGPSPDVNSALNKQNLARSHHSPGVGHR